MKNAKVAILCLSHYEGGMELDSIKHTDLFLRHGIDAILICRKGTFLEKKANKDKIPNIAIDFKAKLSLKLILQLRTAIQEHGITTLVFFGASEIKSICFAVKRTSCKVIVRHGTTKSTPKKDFLHKFFYQCVENYVAISDHLRRNALEILPSTETQVNTIYNSVQKTTMPKDSPNSPTFVFVGRVEKGKGIYDAVEALNYASIPCEHKKLTIVGSVDQATQDTLEKIASSGQVKLIFTGFVNDPESYLRENAFFLFPSYGEGLGNVVIEALTNGLTCITYDNTVFPEFIQLGFKPFYLAKDRNTDDLSDNIESAYNNFQKDQNNPHTMLVKKYFNEEACVSNWVKILK